MKAKPRKDDFQKRLERFVSRVEKEAKKEFPDGEGDSQLDISFRDRKIDMPFYPIPVPHTHLLKTDQDWIDAISRLICNASSSLGVLSRTFNIYQHDKSVISNKMALGVDLIKVGEKTKTEIVYAPYGISPDLPEGTKWVSLASIKQKGGTNISSALCETKDLWPADRAVVVDYVTRCIIEMNSHCRKIPITYMVMLRNGHAIVYVAMSDDKPVES